MSGEGFLSRWVRRKSEAKSSAPQPAPPAPEPPAPMPAAGASGAHPGALPADASAEPPLPPVESLTFDSDFTPFMRPGVDQDLKREAIKSLVRDPRFNVMDGLDVYIDDYSKPDPLPAGWLEKMNQVALLGDPVGREKAAEEARMAAEAEAAAATARETAAGTENIAEEQPVAALSTAPPSDTSDAASEPPRLTQSRDTPRDSG
jgi:hypothetical protein